VKKNVVIISYTYPPANAPAAQRPYAIAKYLDKERYNVSVLSCSNQDSSLGFDPSKDNTLDRVNLIEVPALFGSRLSGMRSESHKKSKKNAFKATILGVAKRMFGFFMIPDKAILWSYNVKRAIASKKIIIDADVIISTSPLFTNHLLAAFIVRKNPSIKWIVDFRDFHYIQRTDKIPWYYEVYKRVTKLES